MGTTKTQVQQASTKAATGPTTDKVKPAPEQTCSPARAQRAAAPMPPPNGSPPAARAGDMVSAPQEFPQAPKRAQMSAAIQRQQGNLRTAHLLGRPQAKIAVGEPGDRYEQEADEVANRVVSGQKVARISRIAVGGVSSPVDRQERDEEEAQMRRAWRRPEEDDELRTSSAQRQASAEEEFGQGQAEEESEEEEVVRPMRLRRNPRRKDAFVSRVMRLHRQEETEEQPGPEPPVAKIDTTKGVKAKIHVGGAIDDASAEARIKSPSGGRPLPQGLRTEMETGLGANLSHVRVHDSSEDRNMAADLNAQAFTHGHHVWLGPGASAGDRKLMAHELTHVVQQGGVIRRKLAQESLVGDQTTAGGNDTRPQIDSTEFSSPEPSTAKPVAGDESDRSPESEAPSPLDQSQNHTELKATEQAELGEDAGIAGASPTIQAGVDAGEDSAGPQARQATSNALPAVAGYDVGVSLDSRNEPENSEENEAVGGLSGAESRTPATEPAVSADGNGDSDGDVEGEDAAPLGDALPAVGADAMQVDSRAETGNDALNQSPADAEQLTPIDELGETSGGSDVVIQRLRFVDRVGGFFRGIGSAVGRAGSRLAGAVSRRITGFVSSLSSGWSRLSNFGLSLFSSLPRRFQGLLQGLGGAADGLFSVVGQAWAFVRHQASVLTDLLTRRLSASLAPILGLARRVVVAVSRADGKTLMAAWQGLTNGLGSAFAWISGAAQAVGQRISGLWQGIRQRFRALSSGLYARARGLLQRLRSVASGLRSRLSSLWQGVRGGASRLSNYVGGLARRLRPLLGGIISRGRQLWGSIQRGWGSLTLHVGNLVGGLRRRVLSGWAVLRRRVTGFGRRIAGHWRGLRRWLGHQLQRLIRAVRQAWERFRQFTGRVFALARKLISGATVLRYARQLAAGLREFLSPIATKVTDKVYEAMPGTAQAYARQQLARVAPAVATSGTAGGSGPMVQRTPTVIQRTPRSTASLREIGIGVDNAMNTMWNNLSWGVFFDMVLNVLLEQLLPIVAIYRQIRDFFIIDMHNLFTNFYWPRNLFTDPLGFLHDLWSNLYHFVVDIVMSLLRRLVNILISFMFWITVILTIIGLVGGAAVVAFFGAILGALAGLGVGAGPGAAAGAGAGGAAGAGVGFGVAMLINEVIFFAFLAVHGLTILTLYGDLLSTRQTQREKDRDYMQLAESALAVGVGLALLVLAWLAGLVAKGAAALLRRLNIQPPTINVPPALSRFGRGAGSVAKPRPGARSPEEVAAALAAEQRLAGQVGGALARQLVEKLGPQVAEGLVQNLGARVASRLTAEQVDLLATLTGQQVLRLSRLGEAGFTRIISLPEAQFNRFAVLGEAQLRVFAGMEQSAFARFAALDAHQFAKFHAMSAEALGRFAGLSDAAFARFAALEASTLNKFVNVSAAALERFGAMDAAGFAMFAASEQAAIERLASLTDAAFNRFAGLDATQFAKFQRLSAAALERYGTLADPVFQRFLGLDAAAIEKFAGLNADQLTRLSALTDPQLAVWASVQESTLALIGTRDAATLAALADGVGAAGLDRLATMSSSFVDQFARLDVAAMQRFMALPQNQLTKFESLSASHLEHLARLPAGELEGRAAAQTQAQLQISTHREVLGTDPAVGRFRANEADTALRVEASRGVTLDRYQPMAPGQKGDWFDTTTGEVYDGCSPPRSQHFDRQINNGNYERSLRDHVNHPTVHHVVVDTTGLGLTSAQEAALQTVLDLVTGRGNPGIVRIP